MRLVAHERRPDSPGSNLRGERRLRIGPLRLAHTRMGRDGEVNVHHWTAHLGSRSNWGAWLRYWPKEHNTSLDLSHTRRRP